MHQCFLCESLKRLKPIFLEHWQVQHLIRGLHQEVNPAAQGLCEYEILMIQLCIVPVTRTVDELFICPLPPPRVKTKID